MISKLFAPQRELLQLRRQLADLHRENARLREQNDSMRRGMRRCVTCDYRLDFKRRQGAAPVAATADSTARNED